MTHSFWPDGLLLAGPIRCFGVSMEVADESSDFHRLLCNLWYDPHVGASFQLRTEFV